MHAKFTFSSIRNVKKWCRNGFLCLDLPLILNTLHLDTTLTKRNHTFSLTFTNSCYQGLMGCIGKNQNLQKITKAFNTSKISNTTQRKPVYKKIPTKPKKYQFVFKICISVGYHELLVCVLMHSILKGGCYAP